MPVLIPVSLLALSLLAQGASPGPVRDPVDIALDLLRHERISINESTMVGRIRTAIINGVSSKADRSSPIPPHVETDFGYRLQFRPGVYTAVPVRPRATGIHGFCGDDSGRVCYTEDGAEPPIAAGRCAPSCRDLPKEWSSSLLPPPRLIAAEKTALLAALDRKGGLLDASMDETVRALLARATPGPPPAGRAHAAWANALAFTPDGSALVTASMRSPRATLWSVATGKPAASLTGCENAWKVLVTPDGTSVVASCGKTVRWWSLPEGRAQGTIGGLEGAALELSLDKTGRTLAAAGGGRAALWRLPGGQPLAAVASELNGGAWFGVMTPDGATLVTAGMQVPTEVRSLPKGTLLATLERRREDDYVTALAVSGDGRTLAAAYGTGAVTVWALPDGRRLGRRHEHGGVINGLAFSADGRFLVSAGNDHSVKVWALPSLTALHTFRGHENEVTGVAVSATGLVASGDRSGVVRLWDVESGAAKGTLVDPSLR